MLLHYDGCQGYQEGFGFSKGMPTCCSKKGVALKLNGAMLNYIWFSPCCISYLHILPPQGLFTCTKFIGIFMVRLGFSSQFSTMIHHWPIQIFLTTTFFSMPFNTTLIFLFFLFFTLNVEWMTKENPFTRIVKLYQIKIREREGLDKLHSTSEEERCFPLLS